MFIPTPSEVRVAPRPTVTVTHNDRTPLTQSVLAATLGTFRR